MNITISVYFLKLYKMILIISSPAVLYIEYFPTAPEKKTCETA